MKKTLSLILALLLTLSAAVVFPLTTAAADSFQEGDVLYFKVENPANWTDDSILYANFTDASRADNGNASVIIAEADKSKYDPVQGVTYDADRGVYCYTVTADDAGASAMRFWRGNEEKLWNCTVTITAADYAAGNNTAVVTDWTDSGYLTKTSLYDLQAKLSLSKTYASVGDSIEIRALYNVPDILTVRTQIFINEKLVSDEEVYTFVPEADGSYSIRAELTVTRFDDDNTILATEAVSGSLIVGMAPIANLTGAALYAHASRGCKEREAWVKWRRSGDDYWMFLPTSIKPNEPVELYNAFAEEVTLDSVKISANGIADFKPEAGKSYLFRQGRTTRNIRFMYSTAEESLFVNNLSDYSGSDFFTYLKSDKANSVSAVGAIAHPSGGISGCEIKKMKGRGNTSWYADKKGFNVTLKSAMQRADMPSGKKFSLISNFQDASLARNRILYDLSDAVGVPYASDSCFIDLYTNGVYQGCYQMCEKIDVGADTLMPDIDDEDYLDPDTGGVKEDFSFVTEIDPSPAADDFHFTVQNGANLTMKAPELDADDPNLARVRGYVKNKFNAMFTKLESNAADLNDYIDVESLAKVYLINEFGKNWDSGAASFFLTYKPDAEGNYKFFASPVWDYDNSLGNARGVENDLRRLNCTDYTLPSGWWSTIKGGTNSPNFLAVSAKSSVVMNEVYKVWFEDFLPAIETLTSENAADGEILSSDVYHGYLKGTAAMNYTIWELVTNTSWICDHSSLRKISATYEKNEYGQITGVSVVTDSTPTAYDQYTFDGQFLYMIDWATSRAAWISGEYIAHYTPEVPTEPATEPVTEPATVPATEPPTEPEPDILPYPVPERGFDDIIAAWVFDDQGKTEGDKLTEYGSSDGYAATAGAGSMTVSVEGEKLRALEWSAPEYGPSGKSMTPIMAAGKNNLWGTPYIRFAISTAGCTDLRLTMYVAGSKKAPATWKLQYSTDGTSFTDTGDEFTITSDNRKLLTAYLDRLALPKAAENCDSLILQLVPVSMTTVSGGSTADSPSGGEIALNYIVIEGKASGEDARLLGDADMDGSVTILDATCIQRYLAELETKIDLSASDIFGDGVDILDATAIQRFLADLFIDAPINQPIKT